MKPYLRRAFMFKHWRWCCSSPNTSVMGIGETRETAYWCWWSASAIQ